MYGLRDTDSYSGTFWPGWPMVPCVPISPSGPVTPGWPWNTHHHFLYSNLQLHMQQEAFACECVEVPLGLWAPCSPVETHVIMSRCGTNCVKCLTFTTLNCLCNSLNYNFLILWLQKKTRIHLRSVVPFPLSVRWCALLCQPEELNTKLNVLKSKQTLTELQYSLNTAVCVNVCVWPRGKTHHHQLCFAFDWRK